MAYVITNNTDNIIANEKLDKITKNRKNSKIVLNREWNIQVSTFAKRTHNPIRAIVEDLKLEPNPAKQMIALSIGDPTIFGNLKPAPEIIEAVKEILEKGNHNGYANCAGHADARNAVAQYVSPYQGEVEGNDIILCSGCSSSIDLCITVLATAGQNILIPRPGFSIYRTLAEGLGIEVRYYNLLPEKNWNVDLRSLELLIDENTAAIIITNPSNPCGSVFSKGHLKDILDIAERNCTPIIADEIYEHLVFPGKKYYPISSLSKNVPVLSCGGLTKRYLVPGWRQGWIVIHDRNNMLKDVRRGIANLTSRIMGSNTLIQGALPAILKNTPQSFYDDLSETLYRHAILSYEGIKDIPGLTPVMPDGAMYMMIAIDIDNFPEFSNELDFVQQLVSEQSVFCLPGKCFDYPNYIRIVLTVPEEMIKEACTRIREFCKEHYNFN